MLHHAAGEYVELPGWTEDITGCRATRSCPEDARDYLEFIEDFVGVPIVLVGVGPGRDQMIWTEAAERVRGRRLERASIRGPKAPANVPGGALIILYAATIPCFA